MGTPVRWPARLRAEVTADRLRNDVIHWADKFSGREKDAIGEIIQALTEIAEGER